MRSTAKAVATLTLVAVAPATHAVGGAPERLSSELRAIDRVAPSLLEERRPFVAVEGGHRAVVAKTAGPWSSLGRLEVFVPDRADRASRVALEAQTDVSLEVTPLDCAPSTSVVLDAAIAFRDVALDTDAFHVVTTERAEELRVLRSHRAPRTTRHRLVRGRGVSDVRIVEGERVEVVDARGAVAFRSTPFVAVDAHGVERKLRIALHDDVLEATIDPGGLTFPVIVDPGWTAMPAMSAPRSGHTAIRLTDDRVLIFGGDSLEAEIFDPKTRTFAPAGTLTTKRVRSASVLLADGSVLTTGGWLSASEMTNTVERWSPVTFAWTSAAPMGRKRGSHAAVALADGRVFVSGGHLGESSAEIYDPTKNEWSAPIAMTARVSHSATLLASGRVLVAGGSTGGPGVLSTAEIFDPATRTFTATGSMQEARQRHVAVRLATSGVVVFGGSGPGGSAITLAEHFVPSTGSWSNAGKTAVPHDYATATMLFTGRVLLVGGVDATAELFDPTSSTFAKAGATSVARIGAAAALVPPTSVLVTGGTVGGAPVSSVELFAKSDGDSCAGDAECTSGFCSDGVCCATRCGVCGSCALAASRGICVPSVGAPVGPGKSCAKESDDPCSQRTCDGKDPSKCATFVTGVPCGEASCVGGAESRPTTCNGSGVCPLVPRPCDPYRCEGDGKRCRTTCARAEDCVEGASCAAGTCVRAATVCTAENAAKTGETVTPCAPYVCRLPAGCLTACLNSGDCSPGNVCDLARKECVSGDAGSDEGSSCRMTNARDTKPSALLVFASVLVLRRRARPSSSVARRA